MTLNDRNGSFYYMSLFFRNRPMLSAGKGSLAFSDVQILHKLARVTHGKGIKCVKSAILMWRFMDHSVLSVGMCGIDFYFRFGFCSVFEKPRIRFGMTFVRFG